MAEEEIIVWGRRYNDGIPFWSFYSIWERGVVPPGTDPNPVLNPDDNSGYSADSVPHFAKCPSRDTAARRVADNIASLPSRTEWEWGAAIARTGADWKVSGNHITTQGLPDAGAAMIYSPDFPNIEGTVHNHPSGRPNADPLSDRYPSDKDWAAVANLPAVAQANGQTFDLSKFVLYIIDHDGVVRGFPYASRSTTPTDAQLEARRAGVGLPPALGPASGCRNG